MSNYPHEATEWLRETAHTPDPEPLDPADAEDFPPSATPPHFCGIDADPWCPRCGPPRRMGVAVDEAERGAA